LPIYLSIEGGEKKKRKEKGFFWGNSSSLFLPSKKTAGVYLSLPFLLLWKRGGGLVDRYFCLSPLSPPKEEKKTGRKMPVPVLPFFPLSNERKKRKKDQRPPFPIPRRKRKKEGPRWVSLIMVQRKPGRKKGGKKPAASWLDLLFIYRRGGRGRGEGKEPHFYQLYSFSMEGGGEENRRTCRLLTFLWGEGKEKV